jgi:hypothetical protein
MDHHSSAQGTIKYRVTGLIGEVTDYDRSMFGNATPQPNNPGSCHRRNCEQAPDESYPQASERWLLEDGMVQRFQYGTIASEVVVGFG